MIVARSLIWLVRIGLGEVLLLVADFLWCAGMDDGELFAFACWVAPGTDLLTYLRGE